MPDGAGFAFEATFWGMPPNEEAALYARRRAARLTGSIGTTLQCSLIVRPLIRSGRREFQARIALRTLTGMVYGTASDPDLLLAVGAAFDLAAARIDRAYPSGVRPLENPGADASPIPATSPMPASESSEADEA